MANGNFYEGVERSGCCDAKIKGNFESTSATPCHVWYTCEQCGQVVYPQFSPEEGGSNK
jgi:hypothetical protein